MSGKSSNKRKRTKRGGDDDVVCPLVISSIELDSFFHSLRRLYENGQLCDVTFRIGQHSFPAHRAILASANSFLGAMLLSGMKESDQSVIELDVDPTLFKYVLDYIYGIRIEIQSSEIIPLLGLSSSYSMIGLRDKLGDMLGANITVQNCCAIFAAAGMLLRTFLLLDVFCQCQY